MQTKISFVIDSAVLFVGVGALIFSWIRFYTKSVAISLAIAVVFASIVLTIFLAIFNKRNAKQILKKAEQKQFEHFKFNLFFTPKSQTISYFATILGKTKSITKHSDFLVLGKNSAQNDSKTIFFTFFDKEKLDFTTYLIFYRITVIHNIHKLTICANDFDDDVKNNASKINNIDITLLPLAQFFKEYKLAISTNPIPIIADTKKPKLTKNEIFRYAFSPKRAKNYLLFGSIILFTSFLVPFKIYYLISGSVLCFSALIIRIYPLLKKQ